jgi:hypothetical protein
MTGGGPMTRMVFNFDNDLLGMALDDKKKRKILNKYLNQRMLDKKI